MRRTAGLEPRSALDHTSLPIGGRHAWRPVRQRVGRGSAMSKKASLAKIGPPRLFGVVPRERLFALLDENCGRPLIWISGPPGAGKTALVASYLEDRGSPTIWYQVDSGDA